MILVTRGCLVHFELSAYTPSNTTVLFEVSRQHNACSNHKSYQKIQLRYGTPCMDMRACVKTFMDIRIICM